MTFRRLTLAAAAVVALTFTGVQARSETLTMLSSWDETYNAVPVFAQGFAERLAEKSGGEISIEIRGPESVAPFEQLQYP